MRAKKRLWETELRCREGGQGRKKKRAIKAIKRMMMCCDVMWRVVMGNDEDEYPQELGESSKRGQATFKTNKVRDGSKR